MADSDRTASLDPMDTAGNALPQGQAHPTVPSSTDTKQASTHTQDPGHTDQVQLRLSVGYYTGLFFAITAMIAAGAFVFGYASFVIKAPSPTTELSVFSLGLKAGLLLKACGIMGALSVCSMGFSLFLMGLNRGKIDANGNLNRLQFDIAGLSPGLFMVLCGTVLMFLSLQEANATFKTVSSTGSVSTEIVVAPPDGNEIPDDPHPAPPGPNTGG